MSDETPASIPRRALLVGIESYPQYPEKQLRAGRNDVLAFWKVCRRLGYAPRDIRVLTSPKLTVQDLVWAEIELLPDALPSEGAAREEKEKELRETLQSVVVDVAERQSILGGVKWLAESLAQRGGAAEEQSLPGFFTYSGHGAQAGGELVLCPSDTGKAEGGALSNVIPLGELGAIFDRADPVKKEGTPHPTDNLTVVLDCCFAASGVKPAGQIVPTLTTSEGIPVETGRSLIGHRVFCASGSDKQSYQAMLGGYWYSAFTWALTVSLEQWTTDTEGPYTESMVSHNELLFRARTLMRALGFRQYPVFEDGVGLGNQRVFHHAASPTKPPAQRPNAERPGGQMDPSLKGYAYYTISGINDAGTVPTLLAEVMAVNEENGRFERHREYWKFNQALLDANPHGGIDSASYVSLQIEKTIHEWNEPPKIGRDSVDWICQVNPSWGTQNVTFACHSYPSSQPGVPGRCGLFMHITKSQGAYRGDLIWVRPTNRTRHFFATSPVYTLERFPLGDGYYQVAQTGPGWA